MRMWLVDPTKMCRQHLLGEHVEMHMFLGSLRKGTSVAGYILKGQLDPFLVQKRHDELVQEMTRRGYRHFTPLIHRYSGSLRGFVNPVESEKELRRRCTKCFHTEEKP